MCCLLAQASPSADSSLSVPDPLMKAWYQDEKHGQDFRQLCDRISEEFKVEDGKKVNKRALKTASAQAKVKAVKTVDMTGVNVKSEEPEEALLCEANMLNLSNCKLVIRAGNVYVKNTGENKVFGLVQNYIHHGIFQIFLKPRS